MKHQDQISLEVEYGRELTDQEADSIAMLLFNLWRADFENRSREVEDAPQNLMDQPLQIYKTDWAKHDSNE